MGRSGRACHSSAMRVTSRVRHASRPGPRTCSLDHLIRPLQERRRDRQAEGLNGLEVDDQRLDRRAWPPLGSCPRRRPPASVPRNARRSINGVTDPNATPFGRAGLRPLPDRPARTSAGSSGVAVSSSVALMKHGGLPGRTDSTGPRSAAAPSRARPNHRCRHTESDRPRALEVSGRRPKDPRDERRRHMQRRLDAPGRTSGWSPAGDSRGSLGPELPGHGRAWRALS